MLSQLQCYSFSCIPPCMHTCRSLFGRGKKDKDADSEAILAPAAPTPTPSPVASPGSVRRRPDPRKMVDKLNKRVSRMIS